MSVNDKSDENIVNTTVYHICGRIWKPYIRNVKILIIRHCQADRKVLCWHGKS